jgi:hypothetical protein
MGIRDHVDEHAARELELFIENTGELYGQRKAILDNLHKKVVKGKYSPVAAPKLWLYWVEAGVRQYAKEMHEDPKAVLRKFSPATRRHVAAEFAKDAETRTLDDHGIGLVSSYGGGSSQPSLPPGTMRA